MCRQMNHLRHTLDEAAEAIRISKRLLYTRIAQGAIRVQKDGSRRFITDAELHRYLDACDQADTKEAA